MHGTKAHLHKFVRTRVAALTAVGLVGCGSVSSQTLSVDYSRPGIASSASPLRDALTIGGYSFEQIVTGTDVARNMLTTKCIEDGGWQLSAWMLPEPAEFGSHIVPPPFRSQASLVQELLFERDALSQDDKPTLDVPEAVIAAVEECRERSSQEISSPLASARRLVDEIEADLETAVVADTRVVAGQRELRDCIGDLGYEIWDSDSLTNMFYERAAEVMESMASGAISRVAGEDRLASLHAEETAANETVAPCLAAFLELAGHVRAEKEQIAVDQLGAEISRSLADGSEALRGIEEFIDDAPS